MSEQQATHPARTRTIAKVVAAGFLLSIATLAIASWDLARGRSPDTNSPLLIAVLQTPDNRTCTRDLPGISARFFPAGQPAAEARALIDGATVVPPRPWFWTPKVEEMTEADPAGAFLRFQRTFQFTPFGSNVLTGALTFRDGRVATARLGVRCPFG